MLQALRRPLILTLATLLFAGALAGCAGTAQKPKFNYEKQPEKGATAPVQIETIRVGYLEVTDALPLWKAQQAGHWTKADVLVELVPYKSDAELRQAFVEGRLDAALLDLVQAIGLKANGIALQVTAVALGHTPAEGAMQIVASTDQYKTPADLKGVRIEVSRGTDEEYAAEQMLLAAGLKPEEINLAFSVSDADRAKALLTKGIAVGVLPEKYAYQITGRGAKMLLSDTTAAESLSQSVYVFRMDMLEKKADAIHRFFQGYNWAVADMLLSTQGLAGLLEANANITAAEAMLYPFPKFPGAAVPSKESVERVAQWLLQKQLIPSAPTYDQLVNGSVLPAIK